jgi:hypothetical protein
MVDGKCVRMKDAPPARPITMVITIGAHTMKGVINCLRDALYTMEDGATPCWYEAEVDCAAVITVEPNPLTVEEYNARLVEYLRAKTEGA